MWGNTGIGWGPFIFTMWELWIAWSLCQQQMMEGLRCTDLIQNVPKPIRILGNAGISRVSRNWHVSQRFGMMDTVDKEYIIVLGDSGWISSIETPHWEQTKMFWVLEKHCKRAGSWQVCDWLPFMKTLGASLSNMWKWIAGSWPYSDDFNLHGHGCFSSNPIGQWVGT